MQPANQDQPGIIPRSMKDVFAYIRRTPTRECLLRCPYLEIHNETIHDRLAPPGPTSSSESSQPVQIIGNGMLVPLRRRSSPARRRSLTGDTGAGGRRARIGMNGARGAIVVFRLVIESRGRWKAVEEFPTRSATP
jgi:centromeric protein E